MDSNPGLPGPRVANFSLERSEKMGLWAQEPQTNQGTRQTEERLLNLSESIQPTPQSAERMQPGDGPLHEPAEPPQTTAVLSLPLGQDRDDPQPAQQLPHRPRIVTRVPLQAVRLLS